MRILLSIALAAAACTAMPMPPDAGSDQGPVVDAAVPLDSTAAPDAARPDGVMAAPTLAFASAVSYAAGTSPVSVAIADLDRDGNNDLAIADRASGEVGILLGTGAGAFRRANFYPVTAPPFSVAAADLDGDGYLDLAAATNSDVTVVYGNGAGSIRGFQSVAAGTEHKWVATGIFGGKPGLATVDDQTGLVEVPWATGGTSTTQYSVGNSPQSVAVGDLDGDGNPDLVVACANSQSVNALYGRSDGSFGNLTAYASGFAASAVATGDLDGDGLADVVLASNDGFVRVLVGQRAGLGAATPIASASVTDVALADFDGDGHLDVAANDAMAGNVIVMRGHGGGSFDAASAFPVAVPTGDLAAADLDGDRLPDIAVTTNAGVSVLLNTTR